jgi:hypothetical protein
VPAGSRLPSSFVRQHTLGRVFTAAGSVAAFHLVVGDDFDVFLPSMAIEMASCLADARVASVNTNSEIFKVNLMAEPSAKIPRIAGLAGGLVKVRSLRNNQLRNCAVHCIVINFHRSAPAARPIIRAI